MIGDFWLGVACMSVLMLALLIKRDALRMRIEAQARFTAAEQLQAHCRGILEEAHAIKDAVILERESLRVSRQKIDDIVREQKAISDQYVDQFLRTVKKNG